MESELYALALSLQESIWLKSFPSEINELTPPATCFEDKQSCIQYLKNNNSNSRAKHIDIKYYFVNEVINFSNKG